jgi:hypothetical protein
VLRRASDDAGVRAHLQMAMQTGTMSESHISVTVGKRGSRDYLCTGVRRAVLETFTPTCNNRHSPGALANQKQGFGFSGTTARNPSKTRDRRPALVGIAETHERGIGGGRAVMVIVWMATSVPLPRRTKQPAGGNWEPENDWLEATPRSR